MLSTEKLFFFYISIKIFSSYNVKQLKNYMYSEKLRFIVNVVIIFKEICTIIEVLTHHHLGPLLAFSGRIRIVLDTNPN